MSNILILNGHHPYPFSEGRLNAALVDRAQAFFEAQGDVVKTSITAGEFDVEEEIAKLLWADLVVLQYPVNWMGAPWSLKKYIDEVFTAGMDGRRWSHQRGSDQKLWHGWRAAAEILHAVGDL